MFLNFNKTDIHLKLWFESRKNELKNQTQSGISLNVRGHCLSIEWMITIITIIMIRRGTIIMLYTVQLTTVKYYPIFSFNSQFEPSNFHIKFHWLIKDCFPTNRLTYSWQFLWISCKQLNCATSTNPIRMAKKWLTQSMND